jgi:tetratricopeptide (TPR) repeat protein
MKQFLGFILFVLLGLNLAAQGSPDEQLAAQYYNSGEFDKAVIIYQRLYNAKPNPYLYSYYLNCLIQLKDYENAEKVAKQQAKLMPNMPNYKVDQGYTLILQGQSAKADKIFNDLVNDFNQSESQARLLAGAFLGRQQFNWAETVYLSARKKNPAVKMRIELADIYQYSRKFDAMIEELLAYLEENPSADDVVKRKFAFILNADDGSFGDMLKTAILKKSQKNPGDLDLLELLIWYSLQVKDFEMALIQSISLDTREKGEGLRVIDLGNIAIANQQWDIAIRAFENVTKRGEDNPFYTQATVSLLEARFNLIENAVKRDSSALGLLEADYHRALGLFGKSIRTVTLLKNLAHLQAFYMNKTTEARTNLEQALEIPGLSPQVKAGLKLELGDILLMTGEEWDASLLYSQVEKDFKNDVLGHEAKFRNARLSFYIGEFFWSLAQLDVLKAATSKLIANDAMELSLLIRDNIDYDSSTVPLEKFALADLLFFRHDPAQAMLILDTIEKDFGFHPIADAVIYKRAQILLSLHRTEDAVAELQRLVDLFGYEILGDNAVWDLARIYDEVLLQPAKAAEYYEKILMDYPGSLYTVEARKRYRALQGTQNKLNG